ncbi:MAG: CIA30 family protein [Thermosynechococcus sp.]
MANNWELGRFLDTLRFFQTLPFVGTLEPLRPVLAPLLPDLFKPPAYRGSGLVVVMGATGRTGQAVVKTLLAQGYAVRAGVRDRAKAERVLPPHPFLDIVVADVTQPLPPDLLQGSRAVINCVGTTLQPNPNAPPPGLEIVGASPEAVELGGMRHLLERAQPYFQSQPNTYPLFDYRYPTPPLKEVWGALDDVVMGGVSASQFYLKEQSALFTGVVSTENAGGFVSIRTRNLIPPLNLQGYTGIQLRVRGDGQRYKFFLRSDPAWDGVGYAISFDTVADQWISVELPFSHFIPVFRARTASNAPPLNVGQIYSLQLMLSKFEYDGALNPHFRPGTFSLEIESLQAYGNVPLPRIIQVSSAGVTRPQQANLDLKGQPLAVQYNAQLGGILTWKLAAENLLRQSGLPYTIVRPCGLTDQPGGKDLRLDQGDRLTGSLSREDLAAFLVSLLNLPVACYRTVEVAATDQAAEAYPNWAARLAQLASDCLDRP